MGLPLEEAKNKSERLLKIGKIRNLETTCLSASLISELYAAS